MTDTPRTDEIDYLAPDTEGDSSRSWMAAYIDMKNLAMRLEREHSTLMEQRDRANFDRRLAENERDAAKADAKEAWGQFYALRKQIAEQRYPGMTNEVKANDA